jgi:hypothetical protein
VSGKGSGLRQRPVDSLYYWRRRRLTARSRCSQRINNAPRRIPFLNTLRQDISVRVSDIPSQSRIRGLGASSTILSAANGLLVRPLPFADSKRLVWIYNLADDRVAEWNIQVAHYLDLREQNRFFRSGGVFYVVPAGGMPSWAGTKEWSD